MTVSKKSSMLWMGLAGVILGLGVIMFTHPRLKVWVYPQAEKQALAAYASPTQNAREMWQAREFATVGAFEDYGQTVPDTIVSRFFPQMGEFTFDQVVLYSSAAIESLDLILAGDEARKLINGLMGQDLPLNSSTSFNAGGQQWVIGYFDKTWAKAANGYYQEGKADRDIAWIQLSRIGSE